MSRNAASMTPAPLDYSDGWSAMKSAIDGGVSPRLDRFFSIRNKRAKLPNGDVGNRNRITGASCANLHDLARNDLTNGVVAINHPEQAQ